MTTFRLATINVHQFGNPSTYNDNVEQLIQTLKPYNLDLIAVQEISKDKNWPKFCNLLNLEHFVYTSGDSYVFGNGFASHYAIKSYEEQTTSFLCSGGQRSFLQFCLDGNHPFVKDRIFAVTHLDHIDENERLKQIKEFNPIEHQVDILMGDMNSLTRDDYSEEYLTKNIVEVQEKNYWEKPCFDLTQLITKQWSYEDAFKKLNPQLKDRQVVTCRFDTRIDYIYLRPRIDDSWILKECSIIDTNNATDHNGVLAVFEKKPEL